MKYNVLGEVSALQVFQSLALIKRLYQNKNHSVSVLLSLFSKLLQLATAGDRTLLVGFSVTPCMAFFMTCPILHRNSVAEEAISPLRSIQLL